MAAYFRRTASILDARVTRFANTSSIRSSSSSSYSSSEPVRLQRSVRRGVHWEQVLQRVRCGRLGPGHLEPVHPAVAPEDLHHLPEHTSLPQDLQARRWLL